MDIIQEMEKFIALIDRDCKDVYEPGWESAHKQLSDEIVTAFKRTLENIKKGNVSMTLVDHVMLWCKGHGCKVEERKNGKHLWKFDKDTGEAIWIPAGPIYVIFPPNPVD